MFDLESSDNWEIKDQLFFEFFVTIRKRGKVSKFLELPFFPDSKFNSFLAYFEKIC